MKLSSGEEVHPFPRIIGAKDVKICFNFLVGSLSLFISLRMICGGKLDIVVEESCKFSGEGGSKSRASIRYQRVVETKLFEYMVEEKFGYSCCVYGF